MKCWSYSGGLRRSGSFGGTSGLASSREILWSDLIDDAGVKMRSHLHMAHDCTKEGKGKILKPMGCLSRPHFKYISLLNVDVPLFMRLVRKCFGSLLPWGEKANNDPLWQRNGPSKNKKCLKK